MPVHLYKYLLPSHVLPEGYQFVQPPSGAETVLEGAWLLPHLQRDWMFSNGAPCLLVYRHAATGVLNAWCSAPLIREQFGPAVSGSVLVIRFTATGFAQFLPGVVHTLRYPGWKQLTLMQEEYASGASLETLAPAILSGIYNQAIHHAAPPAKLLLAIACIVDLKGDITVKELSRQTGVNVRWLERQFVVWTGVSPKEYARLQRFMHTYLHIENAGCSALDAVAEAHGFYDRRHLLREFRTFTGTSPRQYHFIDCGPNSSNRLPGRWLS